MGWWRDDFMVAGSSAGEPGAARAGGLPRGREHREVKLLVELDELALRGGGEQFRGHGGERTVELLAKPSAHCRA